MDEGVSTARSIYVEWAWHVIESYILRNEYPGISGNLPEELTQRRAACFVTLHKANGDLRGCIGTILPTKRNLAEEIRDNAIAAATKDPRFPPVQPEELNNLVISVDILSEPEECKPEDLDPKKYGVIVEAGWRRGVLLPDLPGIVTVQEQLRIALLKAGISPNEPYKIFRFSATRYY
nr:AmmeMemoRadiSam system protein A [Kosmotoga olearia]